MNLIRYNHRMTSERLIKIKWPDAVIYPKILTERFNLEAFLSKRSITLSIELPFLLTLAAANSTC